MRETPPFWLPGRHAARRPYLMGRVRIAAAMLTWFTARGFPDVDTAHLQAPPGTEPRPHPLATHPPGPGAQLRGPLVKPAKVALDFLVPTLKAHVVPETGSTLVWIS